MPAGDGPLPRNNNGAFFTNRDGVSAKPYFNLFAYGGTKWRFDYNGSNGAYIAGIEENVPYEIAASSDGLYVNGSKVNSLKGTASKEPSNGRLQFFWGGTSASNGQNNGHHFSLYGAQIYDAPTGGNLLVNLVPMVKDGRAGLSLAGGFLHKAWLEREVHFVVSFSKPVTGSRVIAKKPQEKADRYLLDFDLADGEPLLVKVAISSVDGDGAARGLTEEQETIYYAYLKGFGGFDPEEAFKAVDATLSVDQPEKRKQNWHWLDKLGYYPSDKIEAESISRTLECGFDDWCALQMAERLGKKDRAAYYRKRAEGYRLVFDKETRFFRGRDAKGRWDSPFDPCQIGHDGKRYKKLGLNNPYTEGNAWQYTWHLLQSPETLVELMGGGEATVRKLDEMFATRSEKTTAQAESVFVDVTGLWGQYAHGNEPCHHVAWLYVCAGRPDRAAERLRAISRRFYTAGPDGLCGNDDCGQMSAWYLFACYGFYPVNPCGGDFVIGAPQAREATLDVGGGRKAREAGVLDQVHYTGPSYEKALEWMKVAPGGKTQIWIGTWPRPEHTAADTERFEKFFEGKMDEIRANGFKGLSSVVLHTYYDPTAKEPFVPSTPYLKKIIAEFHAHDIPVFSIPFKGGDTEEVYFKLFEMGCDGYSTDYPSVMASAIRKLKAKYGPKK